jgi:hypothetical protein
MSELGFSSFINFVFKSTFVAAVRSLQAAERIHFELAQIQFRPKQCVSCPLSSQDKSPHDDPLPIPAKCSCLEALARRIDPRRM